MSAAVRCGSCGERATTSIILHGDRVPVCLRHLNVWKTPDFTPNQPQFIVTLPDGTELLLSFWGGTDSDPEVAPRIDETRWGIPLDVRRIA